MPTYRTEKDAQGEMEVPHDALWGAATQRAIENFPVGSRRFPAPFIAALARIKRAAAEVNGELCLLEKKTARVIAEAAGEVAKGKHLDQFPLDIFQTGSGTSTNMNANEVIASLANMRLGGRPGVWKPVHPNDHVNRCQSSNDVIPSAIHIAAAVEISGRLIPALEKLQARLALKAQQFDRVLKIGRTHLMDAMPVRLGQEFGGWVRQVEKCIERCELALPALQEVALGGTAVGTGFGAHPRFAERVCKKLSTKELQFVPASNFFEALSSRGACVEASGALKATAVSLVRIADDVRLLSSGPRLGLGEIRLPALQPGSSIMPGKVNPVIPEAVIQVGTQVIANDVAVTIAAAAGHLELSTQLPVIAANLLESIELLTGAAGIFAEKCVSGIEADEERCRRNVEQSLALATALVPKVGYAKAAEIAKEAARTGKTVLDVALRMKIGAKEELAKLLDVESMTRGG